MTDESFPYTRLPGRSLCWMAWQGWGVSSLWMGKDHLLVVNRERLSESCKRFYWTDIQALTMTRTSSAGILVAISVLMGLFVILSIGESGWFALPLVPCIFLLLLHLERGETCRCYLHTAVNRERLYSLGRVKPATEVLNLLRERIEAAQGAVTEETLEQAPEGGAPITVSALSEIRRPAASGPAKPAEALRLELGSFHLALFLLMLFNGLSGMSDITYQGALAWKLYLDFFTGSLALVLLIICLIRQRNSDLPWHVKKATEWTMVLVFISYFLGIFEVMHVSMTQGGMAKYDPWELTKLLSGSELHKFKSLIFGIILFSLGIFGLQRPFRRGAAPTRAAEPVPTLDAEGEDA